jgi:hypothetical protein
MVFRYRLLTYASEFGNIFRYTGITSLKHRDVSFETFEIFMGWFKQEYERDCHAGPALNLGPSSYSEAGDEPLIWGVYGEDASAAMYVKPVIDIFILAEAYMIPCLRQDAVDRLVWCINAFIEYGSVHFLPASVIKRVYKHTLGPSALRRLLTVRYCLGPCKGKIKMDGFAKHVLVDVLECAEYVGKEPGQHSSNFLDVCDFHEHADKAEKEKCEGLVLMFRGIYGRGFD